MPERGRPPSGRDYYAARPWRNESSRGSDPYLTARPWRARASGNPYYEASKNRGKAGTRTTASRKDDDGGGVFGFVGNLLEDAGDAVVGLGPGAYRTAVATGALLWGDTKPISKIGEDIARSYSHTYGPLVHALDKTLPRGPFESKLQGRGSYGEFAHRVYEHPLGPLLDTTAVLSGGATAAARLGLAPAAVRRGTIQLRTPSGEIVERPLARQTLRAELQVGRNALLNRLPPETRVFGEAARAGRQLRKTPLRSARSRELVSEPAQRAFNKLRNKHERLAAFWLTQVPLTADLGRLVKQLEADGSESARATVALLRDRKFLAAYSNPTPRMRKAMEEADGLAEAQRALLGITEETAKRRAYMPQLIARGATYEIEQLGLPGSPSSVTRSPTLTPPVRTEKITRPRTTDEIDQRIALLEDTIAAKVDELARARQSGQEAFNALGGKDTRSRRVQRPSAEFKGKHNIGMGEYVELDQRPSTVRRSGKDQALDWASETIYNEARAGTKGGPAESILGADTIRDLADRMDELEELRSTTLAHKEAPIFGTPEGELPPLGDVTELAPAPGYGSIDEMIAAIDADLEAAGRAKPVYMPHTLDTAKSAGLYGGGGGGVGPPRTEGPLHQTMAVLLGRGQFIQDPQVLVGSFHRSVKTALYRDVHALHLEHSAPLPKGQPVPKGWRIVRRSHSERASYTTRRGSEFEDFARQYLDDDAEFQFREDPFTTRARADAHVDEQGNLRVVPIAFSKQLTGQFVRSSDFVTLLNKYPVRVWRHLVLKLRPAWLVNNIVGNSLLYLVHGSDPVALQEFGRALKRSFPRQADKFDAIMRKHFPEHVSGTFIGSQLPLSRVGSRMERFVERPASFFGVGVAQVDRAWEQALRSSVVRAELRKSPELRNFAGKMRRQTDEMWELVDQALTDDPALIERVSQRANDALGDFLSLNRFERDVLRSAFPFYAWYRVITAITLKLPVTHPVKAALLSRLGQAGVTSVLEELGLADQDVINSAKAFIPIGEDEDGRVRGVGTIAANPFATVPELGEFVAALAAGEPGEAWRYLPGANPLFTIPVEVLSGARPRSGSPRTSNRFGLVGNVVERYARSIPQANLLDALAGTKYQGTPENPTLMDQDRWDALMRYGGIPYGRMSPERAAEIARIGR